MKRVFQFEFSRGIRSRGFLYSLIIGLLLMLAESFCFARVLAPDIRTRVVPVIEAWIGTDYKLAYNQLFYVLLPILAALPFGGSYYDDLQSGYVKNICIKTSRRHYFTAKYLSVFLSAMIAVLIPLLGSMLLCMTFYPMCRAEKLLFLSVGIMDVHFMGYIYHSYPMLYILAYILIDCLAAGMLAVFSICIAEHAKSGFSAITTPFTLYVLLGMVLTSSDVLTWGLIWMLNPTQTYIVRGCRLALLLGIGIAGSVLWICKKAGRKDIL